MELKHAIFDGLDLNTVGSDFLKHYASIGNFTLIVQAFITLSVLRYVLVNYVFPPIYDKLYAKEYDKAKRAKFSESMWFFIYYTALSAYAMIAFDMVEWMANPAQAYFGGYPNHPLDKLMAFYMGVETGYYLSSMMYLAFEARVKYKDLPMMAVHHITCFLVIEGSFLFRFHRVAITSTFLHDCGDVFLESSKSLHYLDFSRAKNIDFTVFAVVFTITRCVLYPFTTIYPCWVTGQPAAAPIQIPYHLFFNILVTVLQVLDVIWCVAVWIMCVKAIREGDVEGDIRSDFGDAVDPDERLAEVDDDDDEVIVQRRGKSKKVD